MSDARATSKFDVILNYDPRLVTEHLGRDKYPTATRALTELVTNAFDASATRVDVQIFENELQRVDRLIVFDNGVGMNRVELTERFGLVGVRSPNRDKIGRFGVGRWAVYRLGLRSHWQTVAADTSGIKRRLRFTLDEGSPSHFVVEQDDVPENEPTGTWVEIIRLNDTELLREGRVTWDLAVQLCGYLLSHPNKALRVNDRTINIDFLIAGREIEIVKDLEGDARGYTTITHLSLRQPLAKDRFPADLLFTAKGMTVEAVRLDPPPAPTYLGLVEGPYLDEMVTSNRAAFVNMDEAFTSLKNAVMDRVNEYAKRLEAQRASTFIERARAKPYYPFRTVPRDELTVLHQQLYDSTLEALNRLSNIEVMKGQHQQIVFGLLHRALSNGDLLHVLQQVASLSDDQMMKFRELLERTTLQAVLDLASQVQHRLDFLDMLHELVYGDGAERVRERTQLHKYLENNAWIFGPQFHLATSDNGFRTVIARHRTLAHLPAVRDEDLDAIEGIDRIPDLFMGVRKDYPSNDGHGRRCLLVELKRPSVSVGIDECNQLEHYANILLDSGEFGGDTTHFDLYVVSSSLSPSISRRVHQPNQPAGLFLPLDRARLFARTWSELIDGARAELYMVREQLKLKSLEVSVPEYFDTMFPTVRPLRPTSGPQSV